MSAHVSAAGGDTLYLFRDEAARLAMIAAWSTEDYEDDAAASENILGYAFYVGPDVADVAGNASLDGLYEISYWATAEEAASVVVAKVTYDEVTFAATFSVVPGATLSAGVAE